MMVFINDGVCWWWCLLMMVFVNDDGLLMVVFVNDGLFLENSWKASEVSWSNNRTWKFAFEKFKRKSNAVWEIFFKSIKIWQNRKILCGLLWFNFLFWNWLHLMFTQIENTKSIYNRILMQASISYTASFKQQHQLVEFRISNLNVSSSSS